MTIFKTTAFPLTTLVGDIELGRIGLPDIQRPFVWPNKSVRNLFDSLYRGFPAGYLLFWETGADAEITTIGAADHERPASLAIVDGQQRLTSLYAVLKGRDVLRANFAWEKIKIAFNPLQERFDVADASIARDKAYIPNISVLWEPGFSIFDFVRKFVGELMAGDKKLTPEEIHKIETSIQKLQNLQSYSFTALTLNADIDPEIVAEVFVRINGQGQQLNQADFVMTLMSVFWDTGRVELERFARNAALPGNGDISGYNHFIKPAPDQMLRVTVGLGLKRARLKNVYSVLRGRDAVTGEVDVAKRDEQFAKLTQAQAHALNLTNWHHFLSALALAGYRHEGMIPSQNAIVYCYVLYLIGLVDHSIDRTRLRQAIAEFFFMTTLTGRYTGSTESRFDFDLAQLRDLPDGEAYLARLRNICATTLTNDYWDITLPNNLVSSAARSPARFAYQASLILLGAKALYSDIRISEMIDPTVKGPKATFEQHHLFPRGHLAKGGVTDTRKVNQIANYAVLEWPDNVKISNQSPVDYAPALHGKMGPEREDIHRWHALPAEWWNLPFDEFLQRRRVLMAKLVQEAYRRLCGERPEAAVVNVSVADLIASGESDAVEFKSTLRTNLHTGETDARMEIAVLKTIAGFMNAQGGTLVIGVADDGEVLGLGADRFPDEDRMALHLVNIVGERIDKLFLPCIHPRFDEKDGGRVMVVRCARGPRGAFVKDGKVERFFVRGANATTELSGHAVHDYIRHRFP